METPLPLAMLLLGLVSGVHCVGMCGGIVGAFSTRPVVFEKRFSVLKRQVAFNLGRISTYSVAGAIAGALGGGAYAAGALPAQTALYVFANVVLILMGLYLAGAGAVIARLEAIGRPVWKRLGPLAARLMQVQSLPGAYAAGLAWGGLPCGLVYGALAAAAFAGTPAEGAAAMAGFGLGTLPNLLAAGLAAARLRAWMGRPAVRAAAGTVVLGFGAWGLAHAGAVAEGIRRGLFCL